MFPPDTKFLVIDDFATMRKIIRKILTELGYSQIEEADDGEVALTLIQKAQAEGKPYQFIISDWKMPKMLGIDLLRICKADPQLKNIPFILVTAESEESQVLEAMKAGVSECAVKPFNASILDAKLKNVFQKMNSKAFAS